MAAQRHSARGSAPARLVLTLAAIAVVASGAFSVGELSGAHRAGHTEADTPTAPSSASGISGLSGLSGLSLSGLQNLAGQVSQAAAIAQGSSGSDGSSADLSQLEQQLGISPSASPQSQAEQLQAELNAINACLSGSSSATASAC